LPRDQCNAHGLGATLYQPRPATGTATAVRTFLAQCFADLTGCGFGQEIEGESMADTTVKKVEATSSPSGEMGQRYLASGKRVSMRLWEAEPPGDGKPATHRDYETVGYVIGGRAELHFERQLVGCPRVIGGWSRRGQSVATGFWSHLPRSKQRPHRRKFTHAAVCRSHGGRHKPSRAAV
jgi:hypothetical protein